MRTTLVINDRLIRRIKTMAAKEKRTLSETVEGLLQSGLNKKSLRSSGDLSPLPEFKYARGLKVNISDREALYRAMEGELLPQNLSR